jgi:hypothetical protein
MIRWCLPAAAAVLTVYGFAQTGMPEARGARYQGFRTLVTQAAKGDQIVYARLMEDFQSEFPESSRLLRNVALVEARSGGALDLLRRYAAMGCTLDLKQEVWAPLRGIAAKVPELERNREPVTQATRVFRFNDPDLLTEDLAYDGDTQRFLVSSVHRHKILSCDRTGACESFLEQPDAVFAVRIDAPGHALWATTSDAASGKSALLKFDLRTKKQLERFDVPADGKKHSLGDLAVGPHGEVFASDGLSGNLFTVAHGRLENAAPAGVFLSPQTPAFSADGELLYVPDYVVGIAAIRLADRHIDWLKANVPAALEGIDGLYRVGDRFLAVQNGIQPQRIAEFRLDSHGALERLTTLEANWPGFQEPTHGVQVGDQFYFLVNAGWDRTEDGVAMKAGTPAELWKFTLH